ncbi:MAG: type II secretion system F family protein [Rickettsiales bacterium]|jgi:type IV pilus assembly protein PilC|nr:type II secretion system F family protein [Rickettsiales bacterium]
MARTYSYKALDVKNNKTILGKVEAPNEHALEQMLSESNLILISARLVKETVFSNLLSLKKITLKEMVTLFVTLEQLERANVPLLSSLKDLKDYTENPRLKDIMQSIYETVKNGELLSAAMGKFPKTFDEVSVSLVAMGERTGNLDVAFANIRENVKWDAEMKRKTVKAVRSPLFSLGMLFVIAVVLLKVVVPKVLVFILDQGIKVPGYTTALIKTSAFVEKYFLVILFVIIGIFVTTKMLLKNKEFRIKFDKLKLKIPLIGNITQKINLSRFTKFFGITFSAGIPVLQCMEIANNVVTNHYLKSEINYIKQKISEGKTIAKCLEEAGIFPFIVVRMFKVGEDSGNLEEAMGNIQYFYNSEINDAIDSIVGAIQPMILIVMGGLMVWIIAAVFGPIYGNFTNMV